MFLSVPVMLFCMTEGPSRLAAAVRDARLAKGWSKEEAARKAGISSTTWKRVEDDAPVQDHKLRLIADALGWESGLAFRLKGEQYAPDVAVEEARDATPDDDRDLAALVGEIRRTIDDATRLLGSIEDRMRNRTTNRGR